MNSRTNWSRRLCLVLLLAFSAVLFNADPSMVFGQQREAENAQTPANRPRSSAGQPSIAADASPAPLHQRIEELISRNQIAGATEICSDSSFLRRVHLDLIGVIPTSAEARTFLDDASTEKRAKLVDSLLADPRFARHMQMVFDIMLMERRPKKHVETADWQKYLFAAFKANKPLDELTREILSADGSDEKQRAAARFFLDRDGEKDLLTRDVGRIFLGRDMQCAQCHDHPQIGDYSQSDYFGIFAFFNRTTLFTDAKTKKASLAETADGDLVEFKSVFTGEQSKSGPHLPDSPTIDEPTFKKGEEYIVKPAKNVRSVPKYSRRQQLAKHLTEGQYRPFQQNIANRLWGHMTGRGVVHPYDLLHEDNPATQPELLNLLTDELVAMKFDVQAFLREIALSKSYQRAGGFAPLELDANLVSERQGQLKEQKTRLAVAITSNEKTMDELEQQIADVATQSDKAKTAADVAEKALVTAQSEHELLTAKLSASQKQVDEKTQAAETLRAVADQAKSAIKQLPKENVLSEVAAKLAERIALLEKENAALHQTLVSQQKDAQSAEAQIAKLSSQVQQATMEEQGIVNRRQSVVEQKRQLQTQVDVSELKLAEVEQSLIDTKLLAAYRDKVSAEDTVPNQEQSRLANRWNDRFFSVALQPLTPEQMAMSALQATGRLAMLQKAAEATEAARVKKEKLDLSDAEIQDNVEAAVYAKAVGEINAFVGVLSQGVGPAATEYQSTVQEALFLANGNRITAWLKPASANLTDRLIKLSEPGTVAEELFLAVLTRRPSEEEIGLVEQHLKGRDDDRAVAIQEMAWGLMSSVEFRFQN